MHVLASLTHGLQSLNSEKRLKVDNIADRIAKLEK